MKSIKIFDTVKKEFVFDCNTEQEAEDFIESYEEPNHLICDFENKEKGKKQ